MPSAYLPTEHASQAALFQWAALMTRQWPELSLLFAIPNAGKRTMKAAAWMKAEGLKSGMPDVCLPIARGNWIGLWLEMKRGKEKPTERQEERHYMLRKYRHKVEVCRSTEQAIEVIRAYLSEAV